MSEHAVALKVIIKAQNVSFAEVQGHNHADNIFLKTGRDS
jgi:hypothetical protein